jgi:tRNA(fMet)-specific endonuclease VapC
MNALILDTNAYTRYTAGETAVLDAIRAADIVYMSIFVLGELLYGFRGGTRERENRLLLQKFLGGAKSRILEGTEATSEHYASLKAHLTRIGMPIPHNDLWIAAQALETGSALVTFDSHFAQIPGLRIWTI